MKCSSSVYFRALVRRVSLLAFLLMLLSAAGLPALPAQDSRPDGVPPDSRFTALFNGKDLTGWKGLVANPPKRARMSAGELAEAQKKADESMRAHWSVEDGAFVFDGRGQSLCTARDYEDFELWVDWKIKDLGDSGIYLRGSPQVQIWDPKKWPVGSGGLYNNQKHPSDPLIRADRPIGEWNRFRIIMVGERVSVYLNDLLVVNDVPLENYWERSKPIYPSGQIELQNHGNTLWFKNIFLREIPRRPDRIVPDHLLLRRGARIVVAGDSITEQKLYSRFIETYLRVCRPDLDVWVIQLGWGGERAPGLAARLENDLLPFHPDVVTTCYGMNDGQYRAYEPSIGKAYRDSMTGIVRRLKAAGALVIVGSPGTVDFDTFQGRCGSKVYNRNLAHLRDIARDIALEEGQPFADVFDPLELAQIKAKKAKGKAYHVCGTHGVHPWANGHLVMAYAFLRAMGLDGEIGRIDVDLAAGAATASEGHRVLSSEGGVVRLESGRYPFCFPGDADSPGSTRSILPYVPFNRELNRFVLRVRNLSAPRARVKWGGEEKTFSRKALERGINLAAEFLDNPFLEPFGRVDEAVARKQAFETPMIKSVISRFRDIRRLLGDNIESGAALETIHRKLRERQSALDREVKATVQPVRHEIRITPEG